MMRASSPLPSRYTSGMDRDTLDPLHRLVEAVDPAIRAVLDADRRFDSVAVRRYNWNQTYSASDYRNLMLSYSGTQMMKESDRVGLLDEYRVLHTERFRRRGHEAARRHAHDRHPQLT